MYVTPPFRSVFNVCSINEFGVFTCSRTSIPITTSNDSSVKSDVSIVPLWVVIPFDSQIRAAFFERFTP
jgi:hypothetical protein